MPGQVTYELLKGFLEAFNRHDLDSIMNYFADDCVFYMQEEVPGPVAIDMSGKTRSGQDWQNDLRDSGCALRRRSALALW